MVLFHTMQSSDSWCIQSSEEPHLEKKKKIWEKIILRGSMEWKKTLKIKEELLTILSTGLSSAPHPSISVTQ